MRVVHSVSISYFMSVASVQQVQESSVLQVVTLLWKASILVLQSPSRVVFTVTSAQAAPVQRQQL